MRVLHIGKFFPPHPGGIERCVADLCTGLARRDVEVAALVHAEPGGRGSTRRDATGFDVTRAACHGQLLYAPISPSFPFLLRRILRSFRPDLLHLHVPNTSAFAALLVPAARRIPWILHWHADIPLDTRRLPLRAAYRLYQPLERALLRRASAIIATSAPYRDSSPALAPWLAKTQVIPLGIAARDGGDDADQSAAAPAHAEDAVAPPLRLLTVGRLSYFKGIDVLLRAIADLRQFQLTIVGDGECRESLERLAGDLGIRERVHFAGRIDMDPGGARLLAARYRNADIFCLPSTDRAESFGLVLLEAMRARLPVVASAIRGSGVGFAVRDGTTGLLVPPGDAGALAQALRLLADDAGLRARLGAAGGQRFAEEFTLDRCVDRTLELYRSLPRPSRDHGKARQVT